VIHGDIPARLEDGAIYPGVRVEVLNVLGAGDAFMSGFLSGWLERRQRRALLPVGQCLRRVGGVAPCLRPGHADSGGARVSVQQPGACHPTGSGFRVLQRLHHVSVPRKTVETAVCVRF
jgi:5-dehydro-2-deoxygluconokinase